MDLSATFASSVRWVLLSSPGGIGPFDSKGRGTVMAIDVPVECGGVAVRPSGWVFGDVDGAVVIPDSIVEKIITLSLEKATQETAVRDELAAGESLASVPPPNPAGFSAPE
jgi:regulator of RNase E activity RraA